MKKIPLDCVTEEIEKEGTGEFCSYCDQELPQHQDHVSPCAMCGEYAFVYSAVDVGPSGRKLERPRGVRRQKESAPQFGGYVPTRKLRHLPALPE